MGPLQMVIRMFAIFEDKIVERILQSPSFHRGVRNIHRKIHERQYGRDPNEPLYQGEATENPVKASSTSRFFRYFAEELRNQFRGTPTNGPPPPRKP